MMAQVATRPEAGQPGKEEVKKVTYKQNSLHGIIYKNTLGAKAPPVIFLAEMQAATSRGLNLRRLIIMRPGLHDGKQR